MNPAPPYSPGLEGVIAGETAISTVEDGLRYRGYPVPELAEHCSFDEVAYLLLYGELPKAAELRQFQVRVNAARRLTQPIRDLLTGLPKWTPPLDALRTTVSALAHFDQDNSDNSHESNVRKAERLIAQIPVAICDHYHYARGEQPVAARQDLGQAANFLYMLRGAEAKPEDVRAMDVSLILYAEHEFNASTFAARTIVSTLSDLHSGIVGAIGALKGPLHGGANEKIMDILELIGEVSKADAWIRDALAKKERVMGFGHRVYKSGDVRAGILTK
jgi:citrate synthase